MTLDVKVIRKLSLVFLALGLLGSVFATLRLYAHYERAARCKALLAMVRTTLTQLQDCPDFARQVSLVQQLPESPFGGGFFWSQGNSSFPEAKGVLYLSGFPPNSRVSLSDEDVLELNHQWSANPIPQVRLVDQLKGWPVFVWETPR